jgi:hypothetical protein
MEASSQSTMRLQNQTKKKWFISHIQAVFNTFLPHLARSSNG